MPSGKNIHVYIYIYIYYIPEGFAPDACPFSDGLTGNWQDAYIYTSGTCAQAHTPMPRKEEEKVEEEEVEEEVEVGGWRYDTVPWWSFFW